MTSWILSFSNSSKLLYNTSSSCRSLFVRQLGDFLLSWNSSHMRLKGHSFVDSLSSIWLFSVSFILLLFHFLFHSFHSFSFDCQLGIVFENINAKIADSAKKNPLNGRENALPVSICPNVTGAYMLSRSSFNTEHSITLPMLPRKRISKWNQSKCITMFICRYFDILKAFMYKGWSKAMHGLSIFNLTACLQIYCTNEYIAVGFDALRSTIWRNVTWDFCEYVPVVADCI